MVPSRAAGAATQHPPHGRACNRSTEGRHAGHPDPLPRHGRLAGVPARRCHRRSGLGPPPTMPSPSSTAEARSPSSSSSTPPAPGCASSSASCAVPASVRSRSKRRRSGRRHPPRRRPDGRGDQSQPGPQPARALRLGREQRRPVRRVRAGRHLRTDRARLRPLIPDTAATVQLRSAVRARKELLTTGSGWRISSARTAVRPSRPGRAVRRPRRRHQPAVPGPLQQPGRRRLDCACPPPSRSRPSPRRRVGPGRRQVQQRPRPSLGSSHRARRCQPPPRPTPGLRRTRLVEGGDRAAQGLGTARGGSPPP